VGLFLFLDIMTAVKSIAGLISQSNCYLRTSITLVFCYTTAANCIYFIASTTRSNFSRVKDWFDNIAASEGEMLRSRFKSFSKCIILAMYIRVLNTVIFNVSYHGIISFYIFFTLSLLCFQSRDRN